MERETIVKILLFYKNVDKEIALNSRILQDYEECYYGIRSGINFDGVPRNKYKAASSTEATALNIPDSVSEVMRKLRLQNERFKKIKDIILYEVNQLPDPQGTVIYDFYIRGLQWVQISEKVNYSGTQCKNIRNHALDNLSRRFVKIPLISDGVF